jgi:hypothetical protein
MPDKPHTQVRKLRFFRWFGVLTLAMLLTTFLVNVFVATPTYVHAQTDTTTTAAAEQTTAAVTPAPGQLTVPATIVEDPVISAEAGSEVLPTPNFTIPTEPADAAKLTGALVTDANPADITEECVDISGQTDSVPAGMDDGQGDQVLCADQKAQLDALMAGVLPDDVVTLLKQIAADKIAEYGPVVQAKLDDKANAKQDQRLIWIAIILIGVLPLLTFLLFMFYPLVRRKKILERAPGTSMGAIYRLYLPQALLVTLVMIGLGGSLWTIQAITGRLLGGVTNPQRVLQREAINYVVDNRVELIDLHTEMFMGFADDLLNNEDPDKSVMDILLQNAADLKESPVVNTAISIVRFVMPFLSYLSIVALAILVLFFLLRIRPEITVLLTYPVEILAATYNKTPLPPLTSEALGAVPVDSNDPAAMRRVGQKLMINEVKVLGLFALAVLVVAIAMSIVLTAFFYPIMQLFIDSFSDAIDYFLTQDNAANTLLIVVSILMVFLIESIVIFLMSFTFLLGKLQDALRQRFAKRITWQQTGRYMGRQALRFLWILVIVGVFGAAAPYGAQFLYDKLYTNAKDPNATLILVAIPVALFVVLNLAMWILRGFRMFVKIFTTSVLVEYGLKPPKPKKPKTPKAPKNEVAPSAS